MLLIVLGTYLLFSSMCIFRAVIYYSYKLS